MSVPHHDQPDGPLFVGWPAEPQPALIQHTFDSLDRFDIDRKEIQDHLISDYQQHGNQGHGKQRPFQKAERRVRLLAQNAERQRGARAAEQRGDAADAGAPGHRQEEAARIVAAAPRQAEHRDDLADDREIHGRHRVLRHEERHDRVEEKDGQQQCARGAAEAVQNAERDAGAQPGFHDAGGEDEGAEDEEHGLVAKQRVGLAALHDAAQREQDDRQQTGDHQRQDVQHPVEDAQRKGGERLLPLRRQARGQRPRRNPPVQQGTQRQQEGVTAAAQQDDPQTPGVDGDLVLGRHSTAVQCAQNQSRAESKESLTRRTRNRRRRRDRLRAASVPSLER